jgi:hypothetical protein
MIAIGAVEICGVGMFETIARFFQVKRHDLVYLKSILEAYEGLVTLSTVEREGAIVRIAYPHFSGADLDTLLQVLGREIAIIEVPQPSCCLGVFSTVAIEKEVHCAG